MFCTWFHISPLQGTLRAEMDKRESFSLTGKSPLFAMSEKRRGIANGAIPPGKAAFRRVEMIDASLLTQAKEGV